MPVKFIQRGPKGSVLGVQDGDKQPANVFSIGAETANDDVAYNISGTRRVFTKVETIQVQLTASSVNSNAFIADDAYQIVKVSEVHSVVGGASAALDVTKCTGTTAPGSGTTVFASTTFDLTATINTNQSPALTATTSTLQLAAGDRIGLKFSGTLTGLVGVVNIYVRRI